jgi:hypothetical protein
MVKPGFVKVSNQGRATLMVGMAGATGLWLHLSVKARLGTHIGSHILVTLHAQAILGLAVKLGMALFAFVIHFGVGLHQFAGRNDRLNALRLDFKRNRPERTEAHQKPEGLLKQAYPIHTNPFVTSTHAPPVRERWN